MSALPSFSVRVDSTVPVPFNRTGKDRARRIVRGAHVYGPYARDHYGLHVDREDLSMVLSDLISDLLTFALHRGEDPAALLERAGRSFEGDFEDDEEEVSE